MKSKDIKRLDDLRDAEAKRVNEQFLLRDNFAVQLAQAEARIIADNERQNTKAVSLASEVKASAETLRILVASVDATQKQQMTQLTTMITDRLTQLEGTRKGGVKEVGGWIVGGVMLLVAVASFMVPHLK